MNNLNFPEDWKIYCIKIFDLFNCQDDLFLVLNSNINFKKYAELLIKIYFKYNEITKVYFFVQSLFEFDEITNDISENFRKIYYFFIEYSLLNGFSIPFFNLAFECYEKKIIFNYFQNQNKDKNILGFYIIYLLKKNQIFLAKEILKNNKIPDIDIQNQTEKMINNCINRLPNSINDDESYFEDVIYYYSLIFFKKNKFLFFYFILIQNF